MVIGISSTDQESTKTEVGGVPVFLTFCCEFGSLSHTLIGEFGCDENNKRKEAEKEIHADLSPQQSTMPLRLLIWSMRLDHLTFGG